MDKNISSDNSSQWQPSWRIYYIYGWIMIFVAAFCVLNGIGESSELSVIGGLIIFCLGIIICGIGTIAKTISLKK